MSKQLTQLIVHLQRLNDQMQAYQEEGKRPHASESFQKTTMENTNNQNYPTKKYQSTEIKLKNLGKQKRFSKYFNNVFIFLLVIGIVVALFAAIELFFMVLP